MAGIKGMKCRVESKKERKKGSGGKRPGAGRKRPPPIYSSVNHEDGDAERFLREVIKDTSQDLRLRIDAAKALLPYHKAKLGDIGKKQERRDAAVKASSGRFSSSSPPNLTLVKSA